MLFRLIVVGRLKDRLFQSRCEEYRKRLGAYGKFELTELADSTVSGEGAAIIRELEKERNAEIIVLTEEGKESSSRELAQYLGGLDRKAVFVIGGPFGLDAQVKARAHRLWSLSRLTFPHEIARLLCLEQLYRAENLLHGGSYHHD